MNFIIRIYGYINPTYSYVGAFLTTCRINIAGFGNYKIHTNQVKKWKQ